MPRHHSRRRRRGLGGPLYSILTTLVVVVCVSAALTMFFRVRTVEITGLNRYTEEQIRKAAGVEYGDNLFFMDKYAMKDEILRQLPYIESLRINRNYPDTLRIAVEECGHPMGVEQDGTVWLVSSTGKIVDHIVPGTAAETTETGSTEAAENGGTETVESGGTAETSGTAESGGTAENGGTSESGGTETAETGGTAEQYGVITGCRLLAPEVGARIALATENVFYQQSLLDLLSALDGTGMLEETDAIRMEDPAVLFLDYAGRFTVKLRYDADFPWKLRTLAAYLDSERIQDNMTGTFDMTKDDKNYFQQDVR